MKSILQGVANSSSIPQNMYVFVSVCVWGVDKVTTGSSPQPQSTSCTSQCGRTFHAQPFILGRFRKDSEDSLQRLSLRVRGCQGTPGGQAESIIHSGFLATECT